MTQIDHVVEGIYQISSFSSTVGISFNQLLIDDEHPMLIHTRTYLRYGEVCQVVFDILDPKQLAQEKGEGHARS